MGHQSGGVNHRKHSVQEEFDAAGLHCAEADDNRFTARIRINEWLKPTRMTDNPRLRIFDRCRKTIFQLERYSFDTWSRYSEDRRDPKAVPQDKHSDFPTLLGYIANGNFIFRSSYETIHRLPRDYRGPGARSRQHLTRRDF